MGTQGVADNQAGFTGGLNSVSDPEFLRPDQARQMTNFRLSNFGAALKRLGTQLTTGTPIATQDSVNSVGAGLYWPLKNKIYLIGGNNSTTALTLYSTTYPAPLIATWTNVGALPQYRPVIFTDGTNEVTYWAGDNSTLPYKFDGTTISALGSTAAKVAGLTVYNSRIWGWNGFTNTTPNSLYYSNLSTAIGSIGGDSLGIGASGGGQIVVTTFGQSAIVFCAPVGSSLLILHQRGISRLTGFGQSDITVVPQALTADVGMGRATASGACVYNNVIYFVSDRGMYQANEGAVAPLSTPDMPDPTSALLAAGTTDPSQFTVVYNRQFSEVWVQINGIGIYTYNTILNAWAGPFTGTYATGFRALFEVVQGAGNLPFGTTYGNSKLWLAQYGGNPGPGLFVSECDRASCYKDDMAAGTPSGGNVISAILQAHRMYGQVAFGQPPAKRMSKTWQWANVMATLTAGAAAPTVVQSSTLGTPSTTTMGNLVSAATVYYQTAGCYGPYVDVTITDAGSTGPSQYEGIEVTGKVLGQR